MRAWRGLGALARGVALIAGIAAERGAIRTSGNRIQAKLAEYLWGEVRGIALPPLLLRR